MTEPVSCQDGDYFRSGEMVVQPVCVWSGSYLAWIPFRASIHELFEDEDVYSTRDFSDEPGHFAELLQRAILSQRSGRLVSV